MIERQEMFALRHRMLLAAEVARTVATSNGEQIELAEDEYDQVFDAMVKLKNDLVVVFAELDVLHSQVHGGLIKDDGDSNSERNGRGTVEGVPDGHDSGGSAAARHEPAKAGRRPHRTRGTRKSARRSRPRRDRKADGGDQGKLD